ncbi:MAG: translation elongation factor Ts [Gemmatimonadota bacterium]
MAEITASAVKSLRDRTGAGMMDCKRALEDSGGDEERAIDLLRQRGAAKAAKRAGRDVSEGVVHIASDNRSVSMVEVLTETDFVARSDPFVEFARGTAEALLGLDLPDGVVIEGEALFSYEGGEGLQGDLNELRLAVGENVQLGHSVRLDRPPSTQVGSYLHFGGRIGVLVEVTGDDESAAEAARIVAMHVAATSPAGVSPDDIPPDVVERERSVLVEQAKGEGKPPEIAKKIVEGRMRKFFEENALLEQAYVRDPQRKVKDVVAAAGEGIAVTRFVRFEVGR